MAIVHLLGTGSSVSDPHRTVTMIAFETDDSVLLVDCGGDAVQRLLASDVDPAKLSAVIVTHEHADHVSGFPLLVQRLWLLGRRDPVPVYGIAAALDQVRRIHDAFDRRTWSGYPGATWHEFPHAEGACVLTAERWHVTASPGVHSAPVVGLRVVDRRGSGCAVYSSDTEPSDSIARLAHGADLLVHEATGAFPGHTSAIDAARIAARAGVKRLLLAHLPPERQLDDEALRAAREVFPDTQKAVEGGRHPF